MKRRQVTRNTSQALMPREVDQDRVSHEGYNLYPFHSLGPGKIFTGYAALADWIRMHQVVKIDGYIGVDWEKLFTHLDQFFVLNGIRANWIDTQGFQKSKQEIEALVRPSLGESDSVWGKATELLLPDFFRMNELKAIAAVEGYDVTIVMGIGAALAALAAPLVYVDLPKNELLYRMRGGAITNFGNDEVEDKGSMYKRFYFVDWVISNKHKEAYLQQVSIWVDSQWGDDISWIFTSDLFDGIRKLSASVFRARPWFDPGVWGGQWMKEHFEELSREEKNFAWSFEIIAPENGLVFESDGNLLEVSFDTLMFRESPAILGRHAEKFGSYFPIRFDFLDTFDGGKLSIQCHPSLTYIQQNFGEKYTQDETYYILDSAPDALVYLGFKDDIDQTDFRRVLEESVAKEQEIDVEKYVQTFVPEKHDLYLIPNGTVHSSGRNNMVLEISATPYIFTFKMYDWLQRDAFGKPRPINIEHAFNNLDFARKGARIEAEFISKPAVLSAGQDWEVIHLPTHAEHYYDVHRLEFGTMINVETDDVCHILMLVEGSFIEIETHDSTRARFNYAETFIVPAGAKRYTLTNGGSEMAKVVKAFVKFEKTDHEKD